MSPDRFANLATDWWQREGEAWDEVKRLIAVEPSVLPNVIRELVASAPEGALSYIGVAVLEYISELALREERQDPSLDALIAAELSLEATFEILSGPYPEYLDRWEVRHRLGHRFSPAQLDALEDWSGRTGRRAVVDGDGVRFLDLSAWFKHHR